MKVRFPPMNIFFHGDYQEYSREASQWTECSPNTKSWVRYPAWLGFQHTEVEAGRSVFKIIFGCIMNSKPVWATRDHVAKEKGNQVINIVSYLNLFGLPQ